MYAPFGPAELNEAGAKRMRSRRLSSVSSSAPSAVAFVFAAVAMNGNGSRMFFTSPGTYPFPAVPSVAAVAVIVPVSTLAAMFRSSSVVNTTTPLEVAIRVPIGTVTPDGFACNVNLIVHVAGSAPMRFTPTSSPR